jgi:hypothetical protein
VRIPHGEAEFVVLDREIARAGIESRKLGDEHYVLVESTKHRARDATYLDHDPDDPVTREFLKRSADKGAQASIHRSFLGDIYGIIDGVTEGMGRAVVPRHLIAGARGLRAVKGSHSEKVPVHLHFHVQPVYPRLHRAVLEALLANSRGHLLAEHREFSNNPMRNA